MKYITCLLLLVLPFVKLSAQTEKDLYGLWQFESLASDEKGTDQKTQMAASLLKSMQFILHTDGKYQGVMLDIKEQGTWKLNGKSLELDNGKGTKEPLKLEIIAFEAGKMTINMTKFRIIMVQQSSLSLKESLCYGWLFTGTRQPGAALKPAPEGSYVEFRADGTYSFALGPMPEKGTWGYSEQEKAIVLTTNGKTKQWQEVSVDSKTMVLHLNTTQEEFVFTRAN